MMIKCVCGKHWNYRGKNKSTATCPDCRKLVSLKQEKDENVGDDESGCFGKTKN